jgi:hypothetical protein
MVSLGGLALEEEGEGEKRRGEERRSGKRKREK